MHESTFPVFTVTNVSDYFLRITERELELETQYIFMDLTD